MNKFGLSRREFIKALLASASGLGLVPLATAFARRMHEEDIFGTFLPIVITGSTGAAYRGKVVHIHASSVTNWDFNVAHYYGRTQASGVVGVDQAVVDTMVDRGITELLGLPINAVAEAWRQLLSGYTAGKMVAIKVNFNNSPQSTCGTNTALLDAIAQPVNAVVRGLKLCGVRDQDILVYDAIRSVSDRFFIEISNKDIRFHDYSGCHGYPVTWDSNDPHAEVHYTPPGVAPFTIRLNDSLINATYLINMPIMKGHTLAGVSLGFKNHFGSTLRPNDMHGYVSTSYNNIAQYNALIDLYTNPHICGKTVLTIGDGIYGSREYQSSAPTRWATFGNQAPCSLFFATDPVAIDCVMHDLLKAERGSMQPSTSNSYLRLATQAELGVFESGDPWQTPYGSGYAKIIYRRVEV